MVNLISKFLERAFAHPKREWVPNISSYSGKWALSNSADQFNEKRYRKIEKDTRKEFEKSMDEVFELIQEDIVKPGENRNGKL